MAVVNRKVMFAADRDEWTRKLYKYADRMSSAGMLMTTNLLTERPQSLCPIEHAPPYPSVQRVYYLNEQHAASFINDPILHSYPFAWEAGVFRFSEGWNSPDSELYLTDAATGSGVMVFDTVRDANRALANLLLWGRREELKDPYYAKHVRENY